MRRGGNQIKREEQREGKERREDKSPLRPACLFPPKRDGKPSAKGTMRKLHSWRSDHTENKRACGEQTPEK